MASSNSHASCPGISSEAGPDCKAHMTENEPYKVTHLACEFAVRNISGTEYIFLEFLLIHHIG